MHTYTLTNTGKGLRLVHNVRSRPLPVDPESSASLELSDATAILIRRCEARGDALKILATTEAGEEVLAQAALPPVKRGFKMVGGAGDRPVNKDRDDLADVPFVNEMLKGPEPSAIEETLAQEPETRSTRVRRKSA